MLHVAGRVPWYMWLSQILLPDSWSDASSFHQNRMQVRDTLVDLYRKVLEFEMNCICASASSWNHVAKNVVGWKGLPDLVEQIEATDRQMVGYVEQFGTIFMKKGLLVKDRDMEMTAPAPSQGAPGDVPAQVSASA